MKTSLKVALATFLTLALIVWVEMTTGWVTVVGQWQQVSLATIGLCLLMTLASHGFRGGRLVYCYRQLVPRPALDPIRVSAVSFLHNAANFMLPMRLGELVLPALSKQQLSVGVKDSLRVLLGIRLFDLHVLVFLVVALQTSMLGVWHTPLLICLGGGLFLLPLLGRLSFVKPFFPPQYRSLWPVMISYGLSVIIWLVKLVAFYGIFSAFVEMPFVKAATGILVADLSSTLPVNGFASAGSYEAAFAAGLYLSGEAKMHLVSAIINLHIFLLLSNMLAAVAGWFILALKK